LCPDWTEDVNARYMQYTLSSTREEVEAAYLARFGVPPASVERVTFPTYIQKKEWGYWQAGPVPEVVTDGMP
jgi:hypothetical protein